MFIFMPFLKSFFYVIESILIFLMHFLKILVQVPSPSNNKYFLVYDSSPKYPRGMLSVEVIELGNFDQCMSVSSKEHGIYGAYAVAILQLHSPKNNTINSTYYELAENDRQRLNVTIMIYNVTVL